MSFLNELTCAVSTNYSIYFQSSTLTFVICHVLYWAIMDTQFLKSKYGIVGCFLATENR